MNRHAARLTRLERVAAPSARPTFFYDLIEFRPVLPTLAIVALAGREPTLAEGDALARLDADAARREPYPMGLVHPLRNCPEKAWYALAHAAARADRPATLAAAWSADQQVISQLADTKYSILVEDIPQALRRPRLADLFPENDTDDGPVTLRNCVHVMLRMVGAALITMRLREMGEDPAAPWAEVWPCRCHTVEDWLAHGLEAIPQ